MDSDQSSQPDFWQRHYVAGDTPWDFGGVPADLKTYLKKHPKGGRALIPGCGSGYEIEAFVSAGYEVTALDLAPAAIQRATQRLAGKPGAELIEGDFFLHDFPPASFDVVYERTFLSAIPPRRRIDYRDRMTQVLKYGGALIGYFYYQNTEGKDGPPHGLAWGEGDTLFARHFLLAKDVPVTDSLPMFTGRERWQERRRTSYVASNSSPAV